MHSLNLIKTDFNIHLLPKTTSGSYHSHLIRTYRRIRGPIRTSRGYHRDWRRAGLMVSRLCGLGNNSGLRQEGLDIAVIHGSGALGAVGFGRGHKVEIDSGWEWCECFGEGLEGNTAINMDGNGNGITASGSHGNGKILLFSAMWHTRFVI